MTILHAGEIGRFTSITSINNSDDFLILRDGVLHRVTAETLAAFFNPTLVEVTFADSPKTLTRPDNGKLIVNVDCSGGLPIIILYPKVQFDEISIKKTDLSSNDKLTYRGNGFNIDDLSERDISTQYVTDRLVGGKTQWERR